MHMLPIVGVPETIRQGMAHYRDIFCREAGFDHVSRYVTGLILSPKKTLQGLDDLQVWATEQAPSRRAMHEAVCEAGWDAERLMPCHRAVIAPAYRGRGRAVLSLDWTSVHHQRGAKLWGVKLAWDHVEHRRGPYQTVVTAVIASRERLDGVEVGVQSPERHAEEEADWQATVRQSYEQMEEGRRRGLELLHSLQHRRGDEKRTAIALELVQQLDHEGHFPQAHYAFDNGVLTVNLTRYLASVGKHWVSDIACARPIQWQGQWRRVDEVAAALRQTPPESFRCITVRCRNVNTKQVWSFPKLVLLQRSGSKRLVIVYETADLSDAPRFLRTDARYWESGRVIETWRYRWAADIFHECGKQVTGWEAAQVRKEDAVKRHFRLRCVAQSRLQGASASGAKTDRLAFAKGETTCGQRVRT